METCLKSSGILIFRLGSLSWKEHFIQVEFSIEEGRYSEKDEWSLSWVGVLTRIGNGEKEGKRRSDMKRARGGIVIRSEGGQVNTNPYHAHSPFFFTSPHFIFLTLHIPSPPHHSKKRVIYNKDMPIQIYILELMFSCQSL